MKIIREAHFVSTEEGVNPVPVDPEVQAVDLRFVTSGAGDMAATALRQYEQKGRGCFEVSPKNWPPSGGPQFEVASYAAPYRLLSELRHLPENALHALLRSWLESYDPSRSFLVLSDNGRGFYRLYELAPEVHRAADTIGFEGRIN